ncbi:MAG: hypothetical protein EXX96DRAFT_545232 [Benjaminiella poitrasii]|nr:MAG: hypothetical protein EXX96DRAFT_545232 [Benjaminiella poitrasii]
MEINYISIYDTTADAKFLFVSESVTDVLGFLPEELIGMGGYEVTHPDERNALNLIHTGNVKSERMSTVVSYRSRHKDGHYVNCDAVVHYCYDTLICTNFAVVSADCVKHKVRKNSADTAYAIQPDGSIQLEGAWNIKQERMKNILTEENYPWDNVLAEKERRFCLFLNRYTTQSTIVFATRMSEELVGLDPIECIGDSLYDYVSPDDRENVMKQIELSKSNDIISRVRFNWAKHDQAIIPIEAVISCTYDGLVFVARLRPSMLA